jgi:hypothetical protein
VAVADLAAAAVSVVNIAVSFVFPKRGPPLEAARALAFLEPGISSNVRRIVWLNSGVAIGRNGTLD